MIGWSFGESLVCKTAISKTQPVFIFVTNRTLFELAVFVSQATYNKVKADCVGSWNAFLCIFGAMQEFFLKN